MAKKKEEELYFEPVTDCIDPWECAFCGREYWSCGLIFDLVAEKEGERACGVCGECLSLGPKGLAIQARQHAPIVEATPPHPGDDEDLNIQLAAGLLVIAEKLEKLDTFDSVPLGIFAVKIGEAYQVLGKPWKPRKRKAA